MISHKKKTYIILAILQLVFALILFKSRKLELFSTSQAARKLNKSRQKFFLPWQDTPDSQINDLYLADQDLEKLHHYPDYSDQYYKYNAMREKTEKVFLTTNQTEINLYFKNQKNYYQTRFDLDAKLQEMVSDIDFIKRDQTLIQNSMQKMIYNRVPKAGSTTFGCLIKNMFDARRKAGIKNPWRYIRTEPKGVNGEQMFLNKGYLYKFINVFSQQEQTKSKKSRGHEEFKGLNHDKVFYLRHIGICLRISRKSGST